MIVIQPIELCGIWQMATSEDTQFQVTTNSFGAGWISGMAGILAGHPFETIKVRIQSNPNLYPSILKATFRIFRTEGVLYT
jgi:hypothetical protein